MTTSERLLKQREESTNPELSGKLYGFLVGLIVGLAIGRLW